MGSHPFYMKYSLIYIKGSVFKMKGEKGKLFPSPNKRRTLSWYSHYTEYVWHHKWGSGKPYKEVKMWLGLSIYFYMNISFADIHFLQKFVSI